jgi:2-polyprenyl-3-methyl-5-hydroxy-6-metoxy-1,4-benzoquinol methylase
MRHAALPPADTVLLVDVLHYLALAEQDALLGRAAAAVRPGGRIILRDADTARGWRSWMTLGEELLFTTLRFNRGARVRLRPAREIVAALERAGLQCEVLPAWGSTPFANVLVIGRRPG